MSSKLHPRKLTGANGKPISRSQWKDGFGGDSGPSRGDPCAGASRPTETSTAAVCYVRNTSIGDIRSVAMNVCSGSRSCENTRPRSIAAKRGWVLSLAWRRHGPKGRALLRRLSTSSATMRRDCRRRPSWQSEQTGILAQGVSWGADLRLAAPTRQRARRRGRSPSWRPSIEPRDALAMSTRSGVRPMIAIAPLARAAELHARMDAEWRSLRHGA